jgi:ribosomal protein L34
LAKLVSEILQARDFEVTEREDHMVARRGGREILFYLMTPVDRAAADAFLARFKAHPGKKVIATLEAVPPAFLDGLDRSVTVWDRSALEHEIGRTRIERVVGDRDHGLVDELMAEDFPKLVSPELLEDVRDASVGERIVRPVLGAEDIRELSRKTVSGFRYRLELVPHFVYGYICPLYMGDEKLGVERGMLSVNALTHKVESWNERTEVVYALEVSHRTLEPAIATEDAKRLAKRELVRVNSYDKETIHEEKNVTITEKRKVTPREGEIQLEDRGVFYIPIWCVEGVHGIIIVNASSGKIVSEDYYRL